MKDGSREADGRCGRVYKVPRCWCGSPWLVRGKSRDCLAGVELPDALIDGCLLRLPPAAAWRSAEACDTPPIGTLVVLPAWTAVETLVAALVVLGAVDEGVCALRVLSDEEERCRREGVGCVAPVI